MEINYATIIKYLSKKSTNINNKKNPEPNLFVTQKNIYTYSNTFPEKFKELLTDKFYRYGITVYDNENSNISFWTSIMTILNKNFIIPYTNDEIPLVNQFKKQLLESYNPVQLSDYIKKYDKNDLKERFKLDPDITVLQYLVDILDINILILNFKTESIQVLYSKDIMNPWKQSIFLANYGVFWEPIMCLRSKGSVNRLFDLNNQTFKKIISSNIISYYEGNTIGKEFIYFDNINDVIKMEKQKLQIATGKVKTTNDNLLIDEENDESDSSVHTDDESSKFFVKKDELEEIKKLNKTKINKMKVAELVDLTKKLNILITKKNPTKAILMESILSKIGYE